MVCCLLRWALCALVYPLFVDSFSLIASAPLHNRAMFLHMCLCFRQPELALVAFQAPSQLKDRRDSGQESYSCAVRELYISWTTAGISCHSTSRCLCMGLYNKHSHRIFPGADRIFKQNARTYQDLQTYTPCSPGMCDRTPTSMDYTSPLGARRIVSACLADERRNACAFLLPN